MLRTRTTDDQGDDARATSQRALLLVIISGIVALCVGAAVLARHLVSTYDVLEIREATERSQQMLQAFNADASQLDLAVRDYAAWDEAEEFIRTRNKAFISANFSAGSLGGLRADAAVLVDRSGLELLNAWYDRAAGHLSVPAPADTAGLFAHYTRDPNALMTRRAQDRVVATAYGPALLSAHEVTRSDGSQATGAVLLFARFLQAEELTRISNTSALKVGLLGTTQAPAVVARWLAGGQNRPTLLPVQASDAAITSFSLLSAPDGSPTALLQQNTTRDLHITGVRNAWLLLGGVLALVLTFGTLTVVMVSRLYRNRARQNVVENRYRNVAAQLGESILMADAVSHRIVDANDAVLNHLQYTHEEVCTHQVRDIFPDLDLALLQQVAEGASPRAICLSRMRRADGSFGDSEVSITPLKDDNQNLLCLVGHDISHRKAAEEQQRANQRRLLHMAQHDPLTRLPNRLFLRAKLPRVIKHAADSSRQLALIYLDIDHFKTINDSRGHGFGDKLLQIVAQRLRSTVGAQDAVVRMGGDEFVIVAALVSSDDSLDALASRLQTAISAPISIDSETISVSASIGVSVYPRDGLDLEVLLKHADIALYQAKESGRSCHRMFSADMDVRVSEDVALEQALRHAIGSSQIYMDFQPVVDLRTNRVISFEALMRWRHPELGIIPPARFVAVAEKSGLIVGLGQQAIASVLKQIRDWQDAGLTIYPINVNVAPHQLVRTDFPAVVQKLAGNQMTDLRWLHFEITESAFLQNRDHMVNALQRLRDMGSQVLIDDFGTGYSALSYVAQLPVDTLKIDRSFVSDIESGGAGAQVVNAVIDMARRLRLRTVAEGVETRRQAEILCAMGCDYGQGYLYSKPLSARRTRLLLEKLTAREAAKREARALQQMAS